MELIGVGVTLDRPVSSLYSLHFIVLVINTNIMQKLEGKIVILPRVMIWGTTGKINKKSFLGI